jgi:hypothetical protein
LAIGAKGYVGQIGLVGKAERTQELVGECGNSRREKFRKGARVGRKSRKST